MVRLLVVFLCMGLLSGCETLSYYGQSVGGHLQLLNSSRPIDEVLADPQQEESLKARLRLVQQLREFASEELALPDNDSYRDYAALDREAVVWSLVATPEFSLQPRQWCYPIVGCASYRGYFDRARAEAHAERLRVEGWDVTVEPVPAYSTLGWSDDPVPSTVIRWPETDIAELLFHELAHQRFYLKGDSAFNESFATAVAEAGVRRWLERERDPEAMQAWRDSQLRQAEFVDLLMRTRAGLESLYAEGLPEAVMRRRKQAQLNALRRDFEHWAGSDRSRAGYVHWFRRSVNNARLASVATYHERVPGFLALLDREGGDFSAFYSAVEALAALPAEAREQRLRELAAQRLPDT